MKKHSDSSDKKSMRDRIIGLGETSFSKTYYPELRRILKKFSAIFNNSNDAIYIIDISNENTTGNIIEVNQTACEMLGYSQKEFNKLNLRDVDAREGQKKIEERINKINKNKMIHFKTTHINKFGKKIPVEVKAHKFKLHNKEMVLSIVHDLTEQKRASEKIRKARKEWQYIFQAIGHPVLILDPDRKIINLNQATLEMTNKSKDELIGKKCHEIFHQSDVPPDNCPFDYLNKSGKTETIEMEIETFNGYFLVSTTPVFDQAGNLDKIIHIATDISDRKKAEIRYKRLVGNANDGIFIIKPEDGFEYVNPAFEKITGYDQKTICDSDFNWEDFVHPDDLAIIKRLYNQEKKSQDLYEFRIISPNDKIKTVEVRTVNIGEKNIRIMGILRDITHRKNMEERLRLQNEQYQNLIENEIAGIGISDFNEDLVFVNQTFAEILGYSVEELTGMNLSELTNKKEYKKFRKQEQLRKKDKSSIYETRLLRKDGSVVDLIINASPHKNIDGEIIGTVGVIIDITDKKEAERALKERERWLKDLIDKISAAIFIYNKNEILYVNQTAEDLTGYSESELLKIDFEKLIHPDFFKQIKSRIDYPEDMDKLPQRLEFKIICKNGEEKWLDFTTGKIQWEGHPVRIGNAVDITNKKIIENDLRQNEKRLKMITENTSTLVSVANINGFFEYTNPTHQEILGYTSQELQKMNGFEILTPETRSKFYAFIQKGFKGELDKIRKLEYSVYDKSGNIHFLEGSIDSIRDEKGKLQKFIIIADDITQRKLHEKERENLEQQLQQAQKMESIGRLAGGVAHDLNNMLTPILGYSEILQNQLNANDDKIDLVNNIIYAGERAKKMVNQLLAFSRKQTLDVKPLNLNNVIKGFEKLLYRTIKENINIKLKLQSNLPRVEADIGQIEQVIMNMAVNAQDAMPDGGELIIETGVTTLDEEYTASHKNFSPGKYVFLNISDTGKGIDPNVKQHIFEPFFSTKGELGTGLGLATVYGIIKQHNGDINVYSEIGEGTTFRIYLPVITSDKKEQEKEVQPHSTDIHGYETILLVEDNDQVRDLADKVLKNHGYTVITAKNGEEALSILNKNDKDIKLLLTDVVMPEMSGKELYRTAVKKHPGLKVIYMSGYTEDVIDYHGIAENKRNFIQKPFSVLKLSSRVREILDN